MHGATALTVAVSEYSEEKLKEIPPEEWFRRLRGNPGPLGLHVVWDEDIEQHALRGWEFEANGDLVHLWGRLFWIGRRLYQPQLAYAPKIGNRGAGKYFLDSFRVEPPIK